MAIIAIRAAGSALRAHGQAILVAGACGLLGACAQGGPTLPQLAMTPEADQASPSKAGADSRTELQKATDYWGKAYAKSPTDAQAALNYARNLKALGEKRQALSVLQQISLLHPTHRGINGEYGRLALEFDQLSVASKLLEAADDPTNPDWKVVSARGTVLAKTGKYEAAIPFYERALTLAPEQSSVLNNLALAHAMEGNADKAEPLLKRAVAAGGNEARVNQNLALVLGLQGKYDEAKLAAARAVPGETATANVDYVRRMVKLEPRKSPADHPAAVAERPKFKGTGTDTRTADAADSTWAAQVATAKPGR